MCSFDGAVESRVSNSMHFQFHPAQKARSKQCVCSSNYGMLMLQAGPVGLTSNHAVWQDWQITSRRSIGERPDTGSPLASPANQANLDPTRHLLPFPKPANAHMHMPASNLSCLPSQVQPAAPSPPRSSSPEQLITRPSSLAWDAPDGSPPARIEVQIMGVQVTPATSSWPLLSACSCRRRRCGAAW